MAISIETLTAMLTLDVTGFTGGAKKAVDSAKGLFGELDGGAKIAVAGMAAATTAVVATGVALYQVGSEFSQAYDTIRVGTGATGAALEGLKESFKNVVSDVPASFADASSALTQLNQRLDLTGPALEGLTKQFLNLSRITKTDLSANIAAMTRVFGDWTITDQSKALDEMYRASQATGAGLTQLTERVVQFGAPLRGLGFGFEESLALVGKWEKEGVNFGNVMGAMKKAYGEFAKDFGGSAPQEFRKWLDLLAKAPSASEAATMAIEKLGVRNGPDFAAAAREGRFAYADLVDQITNGADSINQAAADTEHFSEKWTRFVNQAKVAIEPLASGVFDVLDKGFGLVGAKVEELAQKAAPKLQFVADAVKLFWGSFTGQGADIGPELGGSMNTIIDLGARVRDLADTILPKLRTAWDAAFGAVQATIGWIGDHQEVMIGLGVALGYFAVYGAVALTAALIPLVATAWSLAAAVIAATWPFLAVGVAIAAVTAGVLWAYNNWAWFKTAVDAVGQALLWVWNTVLVPVGSWIIGTLIPIILNIAGKFAELATNIPQWFGNIPQALGAVVEFFEELPGKVVGFLAGLWTSISTWIVNVATALPGLIAGWATAFFSWIVNVIVALPGQLAYLAGFIIGWIIGETINLTAAFVGWATSFFTWIVNVIISLPGWLATVAGNIWAWVAQTASELPGQLWTWFVQFSVWAFNLAMSIGGWLAATAASLWGWLFGVASALPGNLMSWLATFRDWAFNLAGSIGAWLVDVTNSIMGWIRGVPGAVAGAVSGMLSVGRSIVEGIWNGISGAGGWLMDKIRSFASGIVSGFMSAIRGGSPAMKLVPVGDSMIQGIQLGLTKGADNLQNTIGGVMQGAIGSSYGAAFGSPASAGRGGGAVALSVAPGADGAVATMIMQLQRTGHLQIRAA